MINWAAIVWIRYSIVHIGISCVAVCLVAGVFGGLAMGSSRVVGVLAVDVLAVKWAWLG